MPDRLLFHFSSMRSILNLAVIFSLVGNMLFPLALSGQSPEPPPIISPTPEITATETAFPTPEIVVTGTATPTITPTLTDTLPLTNAETIQTVQVMGPDGGFISAPGGRLTLDFAPHAVTGTYQITLNHPNFMLRERQARANPADAEPLSENGLPAWTMDFTAQPLSAPAPADWSRTYLPLIMRADQPGQVFASGGDDPATTPVTDTHLYFSAPVTLTYTYTPEEVEDLVEESLHFVYLGAEAFEAIPTQVNTETLQLTAVITHFSGYSVAGDEAGWAGPPISAFEVDLAKGQASMSYDIPLPGGPNGFGPKLTLQYSSSIPNAMFAKNDGDTDYLDTGWVGVGWVLDPGRITDRTLTLNGLSEEMFADTGNPNLFHTKHHTNYRIERLGDGEYQMGDGNPRHVVQNNYHWRVTDPSGTTYYFGTEGTEGSTLSYEHKSTEDGESWCKWRHKVYKLYRITDVHSNTVTIKYRNLPGAALVCGSATRTAESYPDEILYTTNAIANDSTPEYKVKFITNEKGFQPRTYTGSKYGDAMLKLDAIQTYSNSLIISTVSFTYNIHIVDAAEGKGITRLSGLSIQGQPAMSFEYTNLRVKAGRRANRPFLTTIHNGYGGEITYTYATEHDLFQRVTARTVTDQITGLSAPATYGYAGYNMHQDDGTPNFGSFVGFGQADESDAAGNVIKHRFINLYDNPLTGREEETWVYGPGGTGLYGATVNLWWHINDADVNQDWGWDNKVDFVYLDNTIRYTCEGIATDGSNNRAYLSQCVSQKTRYHYSPQYGQMTWQEDFAPNSDSVIYRITLKGYVSNLDKWLFKPSYENVISGATATDTTRLSSTWYTYDGHPNCNTPVGAYGNLTGVRRWITNTPAQAFADTTYAYDAYGNVIRQTEYGGTGTATAYATTDPRTTVTVYDGQGLLPIAVTNALSQTTSTTYDYKWQKPLTETDANNRTTTYTYDSLGRLTQARQPSATGQSTLAYEAIYPTETSFGSGFPYRIYEHHYLTGTVETGSAVFYDGLGRKIQSREYKDSGDNARIFL